jgi:cytochrome c-type biogenesis protein CcmE
MGVYAKLALGAVVTSGAVAYLAYLGASSSWQYYLLVDECVSQADQVRGKRLRVSGQVEPGTLSITADRRGASFVLKGAEHRLPVVHQGPLPDNLATGIDVVVEGVLLDGGSLRSEKIVTRCASKYAPRDAKTTSKPSRDRQGA